MDTKNTLLHTLTLFFLYFQIITYTGDYLYKQFKVGKPVIYTYLQHYAVE